MHLTCTTNNALKVSWRDGVLCGLAPDGGLFIPSMIPTIGTVDLDRLRELSFAQLAAVVTQLYVGDEVPESVLQEICRDAFSFDLPLVQVEEDTHVLELFHGPTCAFKDFGARFMARLFGFFLGAAADPLTVLVATSGDTGSAVANAFLDKRDRAPINVVVLFPRGKISHVQEQQMTTLGHNITAIEVDGTFDDCQRLVKCALADSALQKSVRLSSANSINIARLLPQSLYYIYTALRYSPETPPVFSVPSGNLGNVTAGLLASMMGVPISHFIVACNRNDVVPEYLSSGHFRSRASVETISNAMDVGDPSNFSRILALFDGSLENIRKNISGYSCSDDATKETIKSVYQSTGYVMDPHTAVGYLALQKYHLDSGPRKPGIVLGTAHPAKFGPTVAECIGKNPEFPLQLQEALSRKGQKLALKNEYLDLKEVLLTVRR